MNEEKRKSGIRGTFLKTTAAARGAPRPDQRRVGVYDETTRRGAKFEQTPTPPVDVYMYYCTAIQYSSTVCIQAG